VREAAVHNLIDLGEVALPFLILRSCDWVPQIARMAADAAASSIPKASDRMIIKSMRPYYMLEQRLGLKHPVALAFHSEINTRQGLFGRLRQEVTGRLSAFLLEKALVGPSEKWPEVFREAILGKQPLAADTAVKLLKGLPEDIQDSLFEDLRRSRFAPARCFSLDIAHRLNRVDVLEEALHDVHRRVRNDARFFLEKRGIKEFAEAYRAKFPNPGSVAGFGEVAKDRELPELIPYVTHPIGKVRRQAMTVLGRRDVQQAADKIAKNLSSPFSGEVRIAIQALKDLRASLSLDQVQPLLADPKRAIKLRSALEAAVDLLPYWDRLTLILWLTRQNALTSAPGTQVWRWLHLSKSMGLGPTDAQWNRMDSELLAAELVAAFHRRARAGPRQLIPDNLANLSGRDFLPSLTIDKISTVLQDHSIALEREAGVGDRDTIP
jgi:hypothetical protein